MMDVNCDEKKKQQNKSVYKYIELLNWYAHIYPVSLMQPQQKPTEKENQMEKNHNGDTNISHEAYLYIFHFVT